RERVHSSNPPIHLILAHLIVSPPPLHLAVCLSQAGRLPPSPLCCHTIPVLPCPQSLVPCRRVFPSINQSISQSTSHPSLPHPSTFFLASPSIPLPPSLLPSLLLLSFALFCRPHPSPDNVFDKSSSTSSRLRQESYTATSILGFSTCAPLSRGKGSFSPPS
ncbi:hypothetical protein LY76DRAFT_622179, partial [Colletotrichum caudatum]